jgi:hypothetical protein
MSPYSTPYPVSGEKGLCPGDELMSDAHTAVRPASFFDLYSHGNVSADDIDDFVGRWHDRQDPWAHGVSLSDYLGLRDDEYRVWVYHPDSLPGILTARRTGRPLSELIADRLESLIAAGRPTDATIIKGLRVWLAGQPAT